MENSVTIFSNGVADLTRAVTVRSGAPTEVSLEVRRGDLADVLASLAVYGDVTLWEPPRYRPAVDTRETFAFRFDDTIEHLAALLAGARVAVRQGDRAIEGTLAGLSYLQESNGGAIFKVPYVVVLTDDGLVRVAVREISSLRPLDEDIRRIVEGALDRNLQSARPDTLPVTFSLTTEAQETDAVIRYTVPAAAWKISYRLSRNGKGPFTLTGFAVVDNTTGEDWKDVRLSVVTGEPVTFSTDLAEAKAPRRSHISVVAGDAVRPTEVAHSVDSMIMEFADTAGEPAAGGAASSFEAMRLTRAAPITKGGSARMKTADVTETDAFCVFEAPGLVTVASDSSALVPLFETEIAEADVVLHFDQRSHSDRPYRAVRFKNAAKHSLSRGVCNVSEDGRYAGACVLPACQPGEERLLPHALETAVRVTPRPGLERRELIGLRLGAGTGVTRYRVTRTMTYHIVSVRDDSYPFQIDHPAAPNTDVTAQAKDADGAERPLTSEQLKEGIRLRFDLPGRAKVTVTAVESAIAQSSMSLSITTGRGADALEWMKSFDIITTGPLSQNETIRRCFDLREQIAEADRETERMRTEAERLKSRQGRLRENLQAVGRDEQSARWRSELAKTEDRLVEIEEQSLPTAENRAQELREELQEALKALAAEWEAAV